MFTGIIREVGELLDKKVSAKTTYIISKPKNFEINLGDSVSCNGVCLTIAEINDNSFSVDVMDETLSKSNLGNLQKGYLINLEPASKIGDKLDGHFVQGHVDDAGMIKDIRKDGNGTVVKIEFNKKFKNLIVEKGSICVHGISLTAVDVKDDEFSVSLVDFTLQNTNAKNWSVGQNINLECDILGKYVSKILTV